MVVVLKSMNVYHYQIANEMGYLLENCFWHFYLKEKEKEPKKITLEAALPDVIN